jgi:ribosomal protein S28E/S33
VVALGYTSKQASVAALIGVTGYGTSSLVMKIKSETMDEAQKRPVTR